MPHFFVSIIVPTYKRNSRLRETIEYVLRQDYPSFEVLVVDQSEDHDPETVAYLSSRSGEIRYYHLQEANLPAARNVGISHSRGDIIIFFDDDLDIPPDTVSRVVGMFSDPELWGATGRIKFTDNSKEQTRAVASCESQKPVKVTDFLGGFMSFRRALFSKVGLFDEWIGRQPLASGEDFEFTLRATKAGYSLYSDPTIIVMHPTQEPGGCGRASWRPNELLKLQMQLSSYAYVKNRGGHGVASWAHALWRCHRAWILNRDGLCHPVRTCSRYPTFLRMLRQAITSVQINHALTSRITPMKNEQAMHSRVIKGLNAMLIGQLISRFGSFLLVPVFLSYWSAPVYGEWLAMFAVVAYLSVLDIGMQLAAVNRLTGDFARRDWEDYRACQHSAFALYSGIALVGSVLVLLGACLLPVSRWMGLRHTSPATTGWVLAILGLYTLWSMPADVIVCTYQTVGNLAKSRWLNTVQQLVGMGVCAVLLLLHRGMVSLAAGQFFVFIASTLLIFVDVKLHYPKLVPGLLSARLGVIRELLHPSAMFAIVALSMLLFYQTPLLIVSAVLGGVAVATLSITRSVAMLLRQMVDALSLSLYPDFAAMEARGELSKARQAHRILLAICGALAIGLGCALWQEGSPLISIWTRQRLDPDPLLLRLFILYAVFQVPWLASSAYQSATNQNKTLAKCMFVSSVIGLALSGILIRKFGAVSVPLGFTIGELLACYHFIIRRTCALLDESYAQFATRVWLSMIVIFSLSLAVGYVVHYTVFVLPFVLRLSCVATATSCSSLLLTWLFWLGPQEREVLTPRLYLLLHVRASASRSSD